MLEAEDINNLYLEYANQNIEMPKSYYEKSHETELLKTIVRNATNNEDIQQKLENIYENYKDMSTIDSMQSFAYGYSLRSKANSRGILNKKWECWRLAFPRFYYIID